MKKIILYFIPYLIICALSYFAINPLLTQYYFPMHDDTQPARVFLMAKSLSFGQFPVRLVPDLGYGYGYPLFNFYAPLPYYLGAVFNLFGMDAISATKLMMLLGYILSGFTMFCLVNEFRGKTAGMVSSVLYMYAPYHAVQLYVRGSVGELYAYGFIPLLLYGILMLMKSKKGKDIKKSIFWGVIGFAGILLSHNIIGMVSTLFFTILLLFSWVVKIFFHKNKKKLIPITILFLLGIGVSTFFILPALFEIKYTSVAQLTAGGSNFRDHFVTISQLWDSPWGFGGSAPGFIDGMSFRIGKIHILFGFIGLIMFLNHYRKWNIGKFQLVIINFLVSLFIVSVLFMLRESKFLWEIVPGFSFIQYPWRFLNVSIFSLSILSVGIFEEVHKYWQRIFIAVFIVTITLWINSKLFTPMYLKPAIISDYTSDQSLRYKISNISDEYLPNNFIRPKNGKSTVFGGISQDEITTVLKKIETPTRKEYVIKRSESGSMITNISFFPGWTAYIDNNEVPIQNKFGRIMIEVESDTHSLTFTFSDTPVRRIANAISLFSIFLLGYVSFWQKNTYYEKKFD